MMPRCCAIIWTRKSNSSACGFTWKKAKLSLTYNMFFEYCFLPTKNPAFDGSEIRKWRKSGQSIHNDYPLWDVEIKLHLSTSLAFVLGFNEEVVMKQTMSTSTKAIEYSVINGQHIMDKSPGLNFMFLDCNKIENVNAADNYDKMGRSHGGNMHFRILDINREKIKGSKLKWKFSSFFFSGTNAYVTKKRMLRKISRQFSPSTLESFGGCGWWWKKNKNATRQSSFQSTNQSGCKQNHKQ